RRSAHAGGRKQGVASGGFEGGALGEAGEGALPGPEIPALAPGGVRGAAGLGPALRQAVPDPGPTRRGRADLGRALEAAPQAVERAVDDVDAGERRVAERGVELRHERRQAERHRQDGAELLAEGDELVEVVVALAGQPDDHVEL